MADPKISTHDHVVKFSRDMAQAQSQIKSLHLANVGLRKELPDNHFPTTEQKDD